jgi:hypothetical protein
MSMELRKMIKSFIAGAIAGAVIIWLWGEQIRDAIDRATSGARSRGAGRWPVRPGCPSDGQVLVAQSSAIVSGRQC